MKKERYDGKYSVLVPEDWNKEKFEALRYDKPWRDLCGDGMILALCQEIIALREELKKCHNNNVL